MKGRTGAYNPKNWLKVLEGAFGITPKDLGIKRQRAAASYSDADREKLWVAVSGKMKNFMKDMGAERGASQAGDYLAAYAAGLSPSAQPRGGWPSARVPSRRSRSRSAGDVPARALTYSTDEEESEDSPPPAGAKRKRRLTQADALDLDAHKLHPFPKPGSYKVQPPGSHLFEAWEESLQTYRSEGGVGGRPIIVSETLENKLFHELQRARYRRLNNWVDDQRRKVPSKFDLYTNLVGNKTNADKDSFRVLLDKIAWNEYIQGLGEWLPAGKKKEYMFEHVPDSKFVFTQVFRPDDHKMVADALQKWIGCRIWNFNTSEGLQGSERQLNAKKNWDQRYEQLAQGYANLEGAYRSAGKPFPVPDWKARLYQGQQYNQLQDIYGKISSERERLHSPYVPRARSPTPDAGEADEKAPEELGMPTPAKGSPSPRRGGRGRPGRGGRAPGSGARIPRAAGVSGGAPPPQRRPGPKRERAAAPPLPIPMIAPPPGEDALMDDAAEEEEAIRNYYAQVFLPVQTHDNRLRAEVVQRQNYEALNAVHLMQTDNNVQPAMGAVHMVQPDSNYSDKHFMIDMEGDINEGQKVLVERSKRGPFKQQGGRSTVMDRSAHVTYRKRAGAFEITVRRGVISGELQQLLSKLSMHRMSVHGSHVVIIKGSKRYRLGALADIDLRYLLELVDECLQQYGTCGLELTETRAGSGALYKGGVHSARFKSNARKGRGPAARRRKTREPIDEV